MLSEVERGSAQGSGEDSSVVGSEKGSDRGSELGSEQGGGAGNYYYGGVVQQMQLLAPTAEVTRIII